jgi:hypothetical protein
MDLVLGVAVVIATLVGPVLAVVVTRLVDDHRQRRARQMELFRALMAGRRTPLSIERVKALNLVEVEFYKKPEIEVAYSELMNHINIRQPKFS